MSDISVSQAPKSSFKFVVTFMLASMVVVLIVASIYLPHTISWYFDTPTDLGVSCTKSVDWAMRRLLVGQAISLAVGALIGLSLGLKFRRKA